MSYTRHYVGKSREELDEDALKDLREYLGEEHWEGMQREIGMTILSRPVEEGAELIQSLNIGFGLAGISGRPFYAFCRKYCLEYFKVWSASGDDPDPLDEQGF